MTMVEVMIRMTEARVRYFWYRVALRCIVDNVDCTDPALRIGMMWPCRLCGLLLILQGVGRLVLSFPVEKMGKYQKHTKCLH